MMFAKVYSPYLVRAHGDDGMHDGGMHDDGMTDESTGDGLQEGDTGHDDSSMHAMMSPYLFSSTTGFFILFEEALVGSTGGFIGAMFAVFFFSFLIGTIISWLGATQSRSKNEHGFFWAISGATARWFSLALHYTEMLIVMVMNIWIILAVLFGHTAGWLFSRFLDHRFEVSQKIGNSAKSVQYTEDELAMGKEAVNLEGTDWKAGA
eukprot:CAMPEP_0184752414 /NCGR_PEP_ID=MMETSP0315-20130426/43566_1 /TAXON_ID=101924 /ORGANISM="Rhodosorus marinus, Strain UTEX LB 2760" /LENGTH=206 /DNA_ID=CAMNT_0027231743 /DNA_START=192 /DNA_END=812 /DNA_ORIENTATION=-